MLHEPIGCEVDDLLEMIRGAFERVRAAERVAAEAQAQRVIAEAESKARLPPAITVMRYVRASDASLKIVKACVAGSSRVTSAGPRM